MNLQKLRSKGFIGKSRILKGKNMQLKNFQREVKLLILSLEDKWMRKKDFKTMNEDRQI